MGYILVCDDERSICQMLQIAFQNQGHRVETVTSGEQACRKIDSTLYDVVVTDVRMPQRHRHGRPAVFAAGLARHHGHRHHRRR